MQNHFKKCGLQHFSLHIIPEVKEGEDEAIWMLDLPLWTILFISIPEHFSGSSKLRQKHYSCMYKFVCLYNNRTITLFTWEQGMFGIQLTIQRFEQVGILFPVYILAENTKTKTTYRYLGGRESKNNWWWCRYWIVENKKDSGVEEGVYKTAKLIKSIPRIGLCWNRIWTKKVKPLN